VLENAMDTRVQFVTPEQPLWRTVLAATAHDVYHLPEYARLAEWTDGGEAGAFVYRDGAATVLWPVVVRALPAGLTRREALRDATGVYGYGSPASSPTATAEDLTAALTHIGEAARQMGIVSIFSRLHPLLSFEPARLPAGCAIAFEGVTAGIDLWRDEAALWSALRHNHRRNVRRLQREGFQTVWNVWRRLPDFVRLYRDTMERVGASGYYRFPEGYFHQLARELGSHTRFGLVVDPQGAAVAGGLFFVRRGIVQYHLGATARSHLKVSPAKLLFWDAARRAAATGDRVLHLGGGNGREADSLLRFKKGFATDEYTFRTLRFVTSPPAYRALCERSGIVADRSATPLPNTDGFFPDYRVAPPEQVTA